eukprot:ctg_807.g427
MPSPRPRGEPRPKARRQDWSASERAQVDRLLQQLPGKFSWRKVCLVAERLDGTRTPQQVYHYAYRRGYRIASRPRRAELTRGRWSAEEDARLEEVLSQLAPPPYTKEQLEEIAQRLGGRRHWRQVDDRLRRRGYAVEPRPRAVMAPASLVTTATDDVATAREPATTPHHRGRWSAEECERLAEACTTFRDAAGTPLWKRVVEHVGTRSETQVRDRWWRMTAHRAGVMKSRGGQGGRDERASGLAGVAEAGWLRAMEQSGFLPAALRVVQREASNVSVLPSLEFHGIPWRMWRQTFEAYAMEGESATATTRDTEQRSSPPTPSVGACVAYWRRLQCFRVALWDDGVLIAGDTLAVDTSTSATTAANVNCACTGVATIAEAVALVSGELVVPVREGADSRMDAEAAEVFEDVAAYCAYAITCGHVLVPSSGADLVSSAPSDPLLVSLVEQLRVNGLALPYRTHVYLRQMLQSGGAPLPPIALTPDAPLARLPLRSLIAAGVLAEEEEEDSAEVLTYHGVRGCITRGWVAMHSSTAAAPMPASRTLGGFMARAADTAKALGRRHGSAELRYGGQAVVDRALPPGTLSEMNRCS